MAGMILILHAPDACEEAEELRFELGQIGFRAITFKRVTKRSSKQEIIRAYADLILSVSVVIVLASPLVFTDPLLSEIALNSSVEKKMLPVVFGYEEINPPDWFRDPIRLISGVKDDPRQWNRLIGSLQRRTGNHYLFSLFLTPS